MSQEDITNFTKIRFTCWPLRRNCNAQAGWWFLHILFCKFILIWGKIPRLSGMEPRFHTKLTKSQVQWILLGFLGTSKTYCWFFQKSSNPFRNVYKTPVLLNSVIDHPKPVTLKPYQYQLVILGFLSSTGQVPSPAPRSRKAAAADASPSAGGVATDALSVSLRRHALRVSWREGGICWGLLGEEEMAYQFWWRFHCIPLFFLKNHVVVSTTCRNQKKPLILQTQNSKVLNFPKFWTDFGGFILWKVSSKKDRTDFEADFELTEKSSFVQKLKGKFRTKKTKRFCKIHSGKLTW